MLDSDLLKSVVDGVFSGNVDITYNIEDVEPNERFYLVFGNNGLRWIIPKNYFHGLYALQQWRPYSLKSFISWKALLIAYRYNYMTFFPKIIEIGISGSFETSWNHLRDNIDKLVPIIYIGTKGISRKSVTTLVNVNNGTLCSIIKTPLTSIAKSKIIYEYDALIKIRNLNKQIVPQPLSINRETGVSIQKFVFGKTTGTKFTNLHEKYLHELRCEDKTITIKEQSIKLANNLLSSKQLDDKVKGLLIGILDNLNNTTALPVSWVHGDFMPWNIKAVNSNRLIALDWEDSSPEGLPFIDYFYFHHFQNYLFNRRIKQIKPSKDSVKLYGSMVMKDIEIYSLVSLIVRLVKEEQPINYLIDHMRNL